MEAFVDDIVMVINHDWGELGCESGVLGEGRLGARGGLQWQGSVLMWLMMMWSLML